MGRLTNERVSWLIMIDQLITRRKRYHLVVSPQGETVFKSRLLIECIEYLEAEDVSSCPIIAPESELVISLHLSSQPTE